MSLQLPPGIEKILLEFAPEIENFEAGQQVAVPVKPFQTSIKLDFLGEVAVEAECVPGGFKLTGDGFSTTLPFAGIDVNVPVLGDAKITAGQDCIQFQKVASASPAAPPADDGKIIVANAETESPAEKLLAEPWKFNPRPE